MHRATVLSFILMSCAPDTPLYRNHYARITDYKIEPNVTTPRGVLVDQSGLAIELSNVDLAIDRAEACVAEHFLEIAPFCALEKERCQPILKNRDHPEFWPCYDIVVGCNRHHRVKNGFERSLFRVKIAPDWRYACDGQTMVFPCGISPQACINKGLEPTPECPCSCRSTIQDSDIITTPQLVILAGELIRMTTGFNNPWDVPALAACANIIP